MGWLALLILGEGQCEGLKSGMGEKVRISHAFFGICNLIVQVPPLCNSIRLGYEYIFLFLHRIFLLIPKLFVNLQPMPLKCAPHAIIGESLPTNSGQMSSLKKTSTWKEIKGNT